MTQKIVKFVFLMLLVSGCIAKQTELEDVSTIGTTGGSINPPTGGGGIGLLVATPRAQVPGTLAAFLNIPVSQTLSTQFELSKNSFDPNGNAENITQATAMGWASLAGTACEDMRSHECSSGPMLYTSGLGCAGNQSFSQSERENLARMLILGVYGRSPASGEIAEALATPNSEYPNSTLSKNDLDNAILMICGVVLGSIEAFVN